MFLKKWYELFPEYKTHELYMSGESYAGVYIPLWALAVHEYN
jgi:carboxypeptidase C (cathepsin A)